MEQLTDEQRENLSLLKVHKIKNPKEYGGWSHWMSAWCLIPIIGLIIGIMGIVSDNELKFLFGKDIFTLAELFQSIGRTYIVVFVAIMPLIEVMFFRY